MLYKGTQKICPIIKVGGGGGGSASGYTLEYWYQHSGGGHMNMTINSTYTSPLFSNWNSMSGVYAIIKIPNVETITVGGDNDYYSDCIVEYTSGGSTRSLAFGETVTLTRDAKLKLYEADCLIKGTMITMADGTQKEISTIQVGDKVLCINEQGLSDEDEVTYADGNTKKYADTYDLWEFENGYEVRTAHRHRFYNVERQAMVYLDEFNIGDHTIASDGSQVALVKHTNMTKKSHHFTIFTKNYNNYFANGLLSGNRNSSEVHLGTIEQRQIQSNPSEVNE